LDFRHSKIIGGAKLKLALIVPTNHYYADIAPPINLAILAAYVREKHLELEVKIFDGTVDEDAYVKLRFFAPDVLGLTSTTPQIKEAYRVLSNIKKFYPKTFTVIGGIHASSLPEEAAGYVDCVVVGDGEIALSHIIDCLRLGIVVPKIVYGEEIDDLDSLPFPAFDLLDMNKYIYRPISPQLKTLPAMSINTSRGCRYRCPFCYNSKRNSNVRYHSASYLLKEIMLLKETYGIKALWFHDDEFLENKEKLEEFIVGYKKLGLHREIHWACQARATNLKTGIPQMLKEAGCSYVFIGIESTSANSLRFLKCGTVTTRDIEDAVKNCHEAGLKIYGSFIFGSPNETIKEMQETYSWIQRHRRKGVTNAGLSVLAPFPGSSIYTYALTHGIFTQENVDYDKISISSNNIEDHYLLNKAVSATEFNAFLKDKVVLVWAGTQIASKHVRGILTPTFLRTCLRHPKEIWRLLT
jgi:radical SAM superfamily enzyme YgiQ (UPF0313 family)